MHAYGTGSSLPAYGPTVLRLALAAIFIANGTTLLNVWGDGATLGAFAISAAVIQLVGGILLVLGWLTVPAALALTILTAVSAWMVSLATWDKNLAILGGLICLMLTGPGAHSIDRSRAESEASRAAGRARLRGKM